jgi:DNA-binding response OmpR family regulator
MRRILVVDDDPDIRELARRILVRAGYEVRAAENGLRAMALLDGGAYDAVVTDIVMPDMDGIEFLKAMRAAGCAPPVLAMTGGVRHSDIYMRCAELYGASRTLAKPFTPTELLEAVKAVLSRAGVRVHSEVSAGKP